MVSFQFHLSEEPIWKPVSAVADQRRGKEETKSKTTILVEDASILPVNDQQPTRTIHVKQHGIHNIQL